jgi:hypothetical protein
LPAHAAPLDPNGTAPTQLGGWRGVPLAGATCGRGAAYKYYLSAGARPDAGILFLLSGGGACMKEGHAAPGVGGIAQQLHCMDFSNFTDPTVNDQFVLTGVLGNLVPYLKREAANPFRDYTYVALPYCTGDIFSGRMATAYDYDPDPTARFDVVHRGALNLLAVLDDVERQFPADQPVLVTGFSAGGFGAILNFPEIIARWPATTLLPDAGIGPAHPLSLMTREHERVAARWGALASLPKYCPDPECLADTLGLLAAHAAYYDGDPGPWRPFGYLQGQQDGTLKDYLELPVCGYQLALRRGYEAARSHTNLRAWLPATADHVFGYRSGYVTPVTKVPWQPFFNAVGSATQLTELPADVLDPWPACNPVRLPLAWRP